MIEALIAAQIVAWVAIVVLAVILFAAVRQIGVLHERLAPLGALMTGQALSVGSAAPAFELLDIKGRPTRIGGLRPGRPAQLLFFVSPSCPLCKKLLPVAGSIARDEPAVEVVLVGDGSPWELEAMIAEHRLDAIALVNEARVGLAYQVAKLPYAVVVGPDGTVRSFGLVNSREHLESLIHADETGHASIQAYLRAAAGPPPDARRSRTEELQP